MESDKFSKCIPKKMNPLEVFGNRNVRSVSSLQIVLQ